MNPLAWERYKLEKARESRNRERRKVATEIRALHHELSDPMLVPVPRTLLDEQPALAIVDSVLPMGTAQAHRIQGLENAALCTTCGRSHVSGDGSQGYRDCAVRAVTADHRKDSAPRPATPGSYRDRDGVYLRARKNPPALWSGTGSNKGSPRLLSKRYRVDVETGELLPKHSPDALVEHDALGATIVASWASAAFSRRATPVDCPTCDRVHPDTATCKPRVKGSATRGKARGGRSPQAQARRSAKRRKYRA